MSRCASNGALLDIPNNMIEYEYYDTGDMEYRRIKDHPDYYISSGGDVLSLKKGEPRFLKTWENQHGHQMIRIEGDFYLVHRLVAEAFLPNPHHYPIVRHMDDDPRYNYVGNLRWGTPLDNRIDCIRNGNDYTKGVYCYEDDRHFRSCAEAADYYGISRSCITVACKGLTHTVNGRHLCYESDLKDKLGDKMWLKEGNGYKSVTAIDKNGNRYSFKSRREAAEKLGIPNCGISSVLTGHLKHTHGWRFEEGE